MTRVKNRLPCAAHRERFDHWPQVLTCQTFSSGTHYWELEAEGFWDIGVCYRSIGRKGKEGNAFGNNKVYVRYMSYLFVVCIRWNESEALFDASGICTAMFWELFPWTLPWLQWKWKGCFSFGLLLSHQNLSSEKLLICAQLLNPFLCYACKRSVAEATLQSYRTSRCLHPNVVKFQQNFAKESKNEGGFPSTVVRGV